VSWRLLLLEQPIDRDQPEPSSDEYDYKATADYQGQRSNHGQTHNDDTDHGEDHSAEQA